MYQKKLKNSYIKEIKASEDTVSFKGSICRFTWNGWNVFNPITEGEVRFTKKAGKPVINLHYKFTEFFVIGLLMSLLPCVAIYAGLYGWAALMFIVNWLFFYVGTRIISSFRITSHIADLVQQVNEIGVRKGVIKSQFDPDAYLKEEWGFFKRVFLWKRNAVRA